MAASSARIWHPLTWAAALNGMTQTVKLSFNKIDLELRLGIDFAQKSSPRRR